MQWNKFQKIAIAIGTNRIALRKNIIILQKCVDLEWTQSSIVEKIIAI